MRLTNVFLNIDSQGFRLQKFIYVVSYYCGCALLCSWYNISDLLHSLNLVWELIFSHSLKYTVTSSTYCQLPKPSVQFPLIFPLFKRFITKRAYCIASNRFLPPRSYKMISSFTHRRLRCQWKSGFSKELSLCIQKGLYKTWQFEKAFQVMQNFRFDIY